MNKWVVALIITGGLVFLNSLGNGFVWDDEVQIVGNPAIRSLLNFGQAFGGGTFDTGGAGLAKGFYRPMVTIYYMLVYKVFGLNAFGYHFFQIILHLINGILIFKLFSQFANEKWAGWMSLVWIVHSGISKTVVYAASVGDVLYTLFGLLALINLKKSFWTGAFLLLALLSKESAIILIPILLIFSKKSMPAVFSATGMYAMFRLFTQTNIPKLDLALITQASFYERFLTLSSIFGNYLRLIFWPIRLTISQHWVVLNISDVRFWGWGVLVALFLIICLILLLKIKNKSAWIMFIWFLMGIALVSSLIVPLDGTLDETWLYFPLIGFMGVVAILFDHLNESTHNLTVGVSSRCRTSSEYGQPTILQSGFCRDKKLSVILLSLIVIFLSLRTIIRNFEWHDGLMLYGQAIKNSPPSYELENNYGVELFRKGDILQAGNHFEKSIQLQPRWWFPYNNLGAVYQRQGDFAKAEELYKKSIARVDYYLAYENLAILLQKRGDKQEIETFLREALQKFPQNEVLNTLARDFLAR